jgi:uncharacterized protein YyaL (SSP411 family)
MRKNAASTGGRRRPVPAEGGPKKEGAFYVWSDAEVGALLGDRAGIVRARFGIRPEGNAPSDPHGEFDAVNILYTAQSLEEVAAQTRTSEDAVVSALREARPILFEARAARPRPHLDDKVLTSWNGMMIAAFARAARSLPDRPKADEWLAIARTAAGFIKSRLWRPESSTLLRRYRDGDASLEASAEDYACLIWGLLELFQAGGDPTWLEWARTLQSRQDALFWDAGDGGWFSTTGNDPTVLLRLKEDYDGAEPSASSVSVLNLLTLAHLTGDEDARAKVEQTLGRFGTRAGRAARAIPLMLAGLSAWHAGATQIVIVGGAETRADLARAAASRYLPFATQIPVEPDRQSALAQSMPFVGAMRAIDGRATAYVCHDFTCREPATSADAMLAQLERP